MICNIETLETLETLLQDYADIVLCSHDREFLDNVVTQELHLKERENYEYIGGYEDWIRAKQFEDATNDEKR